MGVSSNPIVDEKNIEPWNVSVTNNFMQVACKNCGKPVGFGAYSYCDECKCEGSSGVHFVPPQEHVKGSNPHCSKCIEYQLKQNQWAGTLIPEKITLHNNNGSTSEINSKDLFSDKLDDYESRIDSKQFSLNHKYALLKVTCPDDFYGIHEKGSNEQCLSCKKFKESTLIEPKDLQGGFKASMNSNKAAFDLIPVRTFGELILPYIPEKFLQLTHSLLNFWEFNKREHLFTALDESYELLGKETGSEIDGAFAVGELYALGAKKYSNRNWEKGIDWGVVWSAAFRHLLAHVKGEKNDPIDGQLHLTSVVWNIIALLHYTANLEKYEKFDSRNEIIVAENKGQK